MEYMKIGKGAGETQKIKRKRDLPRRGERRKEDRNDVDLWLATIEVKDSSPIPSEPQSVRILNLSENGAYIRGIPQKLNIEIFLRFVLPNQMHPLKVKGRVVRSIFLRDSFEKNPETGMGIQFIEFPLQDRHDLRSFLESGATKLPNNKNGSSDPKISGGVTSPFGVSDLEIENILQKMKNSNTA